MKKFLKTDIVIGVSFGAVIYIIGFIISSLVYMNISDSTFEILIYMCFALGLIFSMSALLYKAFYILSMCIRTGIAFFSYFIILIAFAGSDFMLKIEEYCGLSSGSASDNTSGLMLLIFLLFVFTFCLAIILIKTILKAIIKEK